MIQPPAIPETCAIAFKEWAGVCDALGSGRQSLILRKGGVSEGLGGFQPDHPVFWLYPTFVHEAEQGLKSPRRSRLVETPGLVAIDTLAVVEWVSRVERVKQLPALEPFHDWTEATVLKRFHYRSPGLWAMVVRVYRKIEASRIAITPEHQGCKTWVPLESSLVTAGLVAVLDEVEAATRLASIRLANPQLETPRPQL